MRWKSIETLLATKALQPMSGWRGPFRGSALKSAAIQNRAMAHHSVPEIALTSKLSALIRAKDWSKTLLGAIDSWPPSLTLVVNVMLASGFPMAVRWGADFVMIYNDGYRPILGDKHPWALGLPFREVWPEVQAQLAPLHEALIAGKRGAFFAEDLLLRIQRHGSAWEDARFTISYSPIPDPSAPTGVGGVLITAVETTNRVLTEEALRASEERFAGIFRQTSVGVVQCDVNGRFLLANARFCEISGRTEHELLSLSMSEVTHPDDREDILGHLNHLATDGAPFTLETRHIRADGSAIWVSSDVALTRDAEGRPQHFVAVIQDITEGKRSQEKQTLLLGEMNHRVKNLFAVTKGMISLSARSAETPSDLMQKITGRLNALAIAHELILPELSKDAQARPTKIDNVIQKILSPYIDSSQPGDSRRLITSGPTIMVGTRALSTLALILHEFATNAAKYGALSVPEGSVTITWFERGDFLVLRWEERGGPRLVGPPRAEGFGTRLAGYSIRGQLGGELTYQWHPEGLLIDLSFPVKRLSD
jgi:PAS domain S-box-containing protein